MSHSIEKARGFARKKIEEAETHLRRAKKHAADGDLAKGARGASWAVESAAEAWVHGVYGNDTEVRKEAKNIRREAHWLLVKIMKAPRAAASSQRGAGDKRGSSQRGAGGKRSSRASLSAALRRDR